MNTRKPNKHSHSILLGVIGLGFLFASQSFADSWADKVSFKGDVRYRFDWLNKPNQNGKHKLRARLGAEAKISDQWSGAIRAATGATNVTTSTNQDLGSGFSKKDLNLDAAYFTYKPGWANGNKSWIFGKHDVPFYRPNKDELIWDRDITLEGISSVYNHPFGDWNLLFNLGAYSAVERSSDRDTYLLGIQLGLEGKLSEQVSLTPFVAFYDFTNLSGRASLNPKTATDMNGNSQSGTAAAPLYLNDFRLLNAGLGTDFNMIEGWPIGVYFDYVTNSGATSKKNGWLAGFSFGKAKEAHTMVFTYEYRRLQADSTVGFLTCSDFGSGARTDTKGHSFGLKYKLTDNVETGFSYSIASATVDQSADIHHALVDLQLSF